MAKKKSSGKPKSSKSRSAAKAPPKPKRRKPSAKKRSRSNRAAQLESQTAAVSITFNVECNCPRDCSVTASGTLNPPVQGLTNQHLEPSERVAWEIFNTDGTPTGESGEAEVDANLEWSVDVPSFGSRGQSYLFRVAATWKVPVIVAADRVFTCN